ncbi:HEPN domain-containing protein [Streptomyces hiroshimensis]|uniref:HEPN domain-containing protein n=1 Tax=Streptomyces hiroshimensis TaxID=66424 RepID=UPI0016797BB1|nr:HEPN domain-containing protein [Streptomyces hiroshimensis]
MTPPQEDPAADEVAIRRIFGDGFVDWVLAVDGQPTRTPEQLSVATLVHRASQGVVPEGAPVPAYLRISHLGMINPDTGKTLLNELRLASGGTELVLPEPPDDNVLAALHVWAAENFGGLLLGEGGFSLGWGGQARERMTRAIAEDPALPFTIESAPTDGLLHVTSAGSAGGLQLAMLGPGIVAAAFRRASARCAATPELDDLLTDLPAALNTARALYAGKAVQTLGLAGLSGVLLPEGKPELTAPWGRVRIALETDNRLVDSLRDLTSMSLPDGSQLVSRGTGDLTVETTVPWVSEFAQQPAESEFPSAISSSSYSHLERRVQDVRLAFALAMDNPHLPPLLPTWAKIDNPIADVTGYTMTEIARLRQRTPTRLSVEQAEEWERWIAVLDGLALENLGHASQRLLRAITERQDPVDALVDAVIVWESIFGTHSEITFRVCASLARLLCHTLEERLVFMKKAKGVYTMRSKIVHGASDVKMEKISESRDVAVQVAIAALRAVLQERPDLLAFADSGKRSEHIMLE